MVVTITTVATIAKVATVVAVVMVVKTFFIVSMGFNSRVTWQDKEVPFSLVVVSVLDVVGIDCCRGHWRGV